MRAASVVALLTLCALVGCTAQPTGDTGSPAAAAPTAEPAAGIGRSTSNRGITLTVTSAGPVDSVEMNESNYQPGSGYETYTATKPRTGGRFVAVTAHVVNNGKVSIDLTCGLPITTTLVDSQDRRFDAVDDLYKIKGNPECNDNLQPGFEADMTWVYLVPTSAEVVGWTFQDTTDLTGAEDATTVRVDA